MAPSGSFPFQTGAVAGMIRDKDWSTTPLGPIEEWPGHLKATLSLVLSSEVPMAIMWGPTGVMLYNDGYALTAGVRHRAVLGLPVTEAWPQFAEHSRGVLRAAFEHGQALSFADADVVRERDGSRESVWLTVSYSPVLDPDGSPAGILAIIKETTEEVLLEHRLRIAQEASGVGAFVWYPDQGRVEVSDECRRIWGISADVVVTEALVVEQLHPDDRASLGVAKRHSENPLEYAEYRRIDPATGETRWIARQGEMVSSHESGVRRFIGVTTDITERRKVEEALRRSEGRFRSLAESLPNVIWTAMADGMVDWFNDWAYAFTAAPAGELTGARWTAYLHEDDVETAVAAWANALTTGEPYEAELRIRRADGVYRWHISRATPIRDDSGAIGWWVGSASDIDHRKAGEAALALQAADLEARVNAEVRDRRQAEAALQRSQRLETIGKLTGGVAHDFNNILQVVSGNLHLLAMDVAGHASAERRVNDALAAVSRGATLASQLLAFGRRQPLAPKVVDPARLVLGMQDMLRRTLGEAIEIEVRAAEGLWHTLADPNQIENAALNLAINARDAMEGEGRLTIELTNVVLDEAEADGELEATAGDYVLLTVTDTGAGIAPELIGEVFKPFFTTKPEGRGSGLGLSMVDGFVKQSGGHVRIESALDQGTTVRLYLPRADRSEERATAISAPEIPRGGETILIVEDDETVRAVAAETLLSLGYAVLQAPSPSAALETLRSSAHIDLLFTDVVMPGPLSSSDLAREAGRLRPGIAVLFTSGYPEDVIGHGGKLDDGVELLNKPHTREALARKVRAVLARGAARSNGHLPAQTPQAAPAAAGLRILLVEDDEIIRLVSGEILRDLGHQVAEAASGEDAITALVAAPADVLITDIRLPGIAGDTLAAFARHLRPTMGVIFASGGVIDAPPFGGAPPYVLRKPYDAWDLATAVAEVAPSNHAR